MGAGQFSCDNQLVSLKQALDGNTGFGIMLQAVRHNGVCDLVTKLIRVSLRDLFRCEYPHNLFPFKTKAPQGFLPRGNLSCY